MRIKNVMSSFTEFSFDELPINEQEFVDYQSKYLDIRDRVTKQNESEKTSILNEIDFEIELIRRDEVNVAYILSLLVQLQKEDLEGTATTETKAKKEKAIKEMLNNQVALRSKKELIEKFIESHLPTITNPDVVTEKFDNYLEEERKDAIIKISKEEELDIEKLSRTIQNYLFTQKTPLNDEIVDIMLTQPKLLDRKKKIPRVITKIKDYVETFVSGFA